MSAKHALGNPQPQLPKVGRYEVAAPPRGPVREDARHPRPLEFSLDRAMRSALREQERCVACRRIELELRVEEIDPVVFRAGQFPKG